MVFFDCKFLVLLALILVVYFLYREIEFLHNKIDKLENVITAFSEKQNITNQDQAEDIVSIESNNCISNNVQTSYDSVDKSCETVVYMNQHDLNLIPSINNLINLSVLNNIDDSDESNINNISYDENVESEDSKHLAIYSNDNEQQNETPCSLIESIKNSNDYKTINIANNNLLSDNISDEINKEKIENILTDQNNNIKMDASCHSSDKQEVSSEYNLIKLNNMKLIELKKVAEKYKILLTKKIDGIYKAKNKSELINEILENFK